MEDNPILSVEAKKQPRCVLGQPLTLPQSFPASLTFVTSESWESLLTRLHCWRGFWFGQVLLEKTARRHPPPQPSPAEGSSCEGSAGGQNVLPAVAGTRGWWKSCKIKPRGYFSPFLEGVTLLPKAISKEISFFSSKQRWFPPPDSLWRFVQPWLLPLGHFFPPSVQPETIFL